MTTVRTFPMFRSVDPQRDPPDKLRKRQSTKRRPGNVPFVVDNLWEWKRWKDYPDYPSRRFSVFASPRVELARQCGPTGGAVYRIDLVGEFKLCQVPGHADSKEHEECRSLPKKLLEGLGQEWLDGRLEQKEQAGKLWLPCLDPNEVEGLFDTVPRLRDMREDVWKAINYWEALALITDPRGILNLDGELFFEPSSRQGEGFILRAIGREPSQRGLSAAGPAT